MMKFLIDSFACTIRNKTANIFFLGLLSLVLFSCGGNKGGDDPDDKPKPLTKVQILLPQLQQESRVEALDVLISSADKNGIQRWRAATQATAVTDDSGKPIAGTFSILAVTGEQTDVYVFVNVRAELTAKGVFTDKLTELSVDDLIKTLLHSDLKGLQKPNAQMPMSGSLANVSLSPDKVNNLNMALLHVVGRTSIQLDDHIANFKLREFYAFYPATSGRIVPKASSLESTPDGGCKVVDTTLPEGFVGGSETDSIAIKSDTDVRSINNLYLYENKIWTPLGLDRTTTRFVVGGVYIDGNGNMDMKSDNVTPNVTYYRIDIQSASGLLPILRNNESLLTISEVQKSGVATPRIAAEANATINGSLKIKEINKADWTNGNMGDGNVEIN